jgi:hypothetical protein
MQLHHPSRGRRQSCDGAADIVPALRALEFTFDVFFAFQHFGQQVDVFQRRQRRPRARVLACQVGRHGEQVGFRVLDRSASSPVAAQQPQVTSCARSSASSLAEPRRRKKPRSSRRRSA